MPTELALKTLLILLVVVGGIAPLMSWIERKRAGGAQANVRRSGIGELTPAGKHHPLAEKVALLGSARFASAAAQRVLQRAIPLIVAIPAIIAFAVIPLGGEYQFGDTRFSLVLSDADWGMLTLFALAMLGTYGSVIAGCSNDAEPALLRSVRAPAQMLSYQLAMGLSLVGLFMVFETLKLSEIAMAQDTTLRALGLFEHAFGLSRPLLEWARLPAWGVIYQPLAFVLFLASITAANARAPFDLPEGDAEQIASKHFEYSGLHFGLFFNSESVQIVVSAGLLATLFLGGWSVPYLSSDFILYGVGRWLGDGFANGFLLLIHVAAFVAKLAAMIGVQLALRAAVRRMSYLRAMDLCWKVILPLAFGNILATGLVLLAVRQSA